MKESCGASTHLRTWAQVKTNKKKTQMNTTGRGTAPPPFTISEELALANNKSRPMMVGVAGGMSSDPTASTSKAVVTIEGTNIVLEKPPTINLQSEQCQIGTDTIRALYKRNLELDNDIKGALYKRKELDNDIKVLEDVRKIARAAELALPLPLPLLPILLAKRRRKVVHPEELRLLLAKRRRKVVHQAEVAGMTGIKLAGNQTISPSLQPLDPGGLLRSWIATCQLTS
ncbi:unnamed protein product [Boreogadus saida]